MTATPTSLKHSEERFQLLVDSMQDYAIFMLDVSGHVVTWNRGAQRINGWHAHEIIGRSFEAFYPQDAIDSGWPQEELRRAARDGRFEDQGWRVRKDGSRLWAHVVITALRGDDGELRGFAKVTRDLTERKLQEEALRQSEEQFRLLVHSVRDCAIFMLDPGGYIRTWNAGAASIYGFTAVEVINQHFSRFFTQEDRETGYPARELATALKSGHAKEQGWRLRKDGTLFWADATLAPVKDADGHLRGFAKVTRDLTERRRLAELEDASRHMSEFLAMLGHELRNPLAPIRNAVTIMQMQRDLPPMIEKTRDIIRRQTDQLTRLVDDLLDVGRIVTGKILLKNEPIDYREVVQASVEAARPLIDARRHRLRVNVPAAVLPMRGDAIRLTQTLQNLLNNAARYTPEGGDVTLNVRLDGDTCVTEVVDTGHGIEGAAMERIFKLFAQEDRDRSNDGGLGIGLSLARTLVEQHGGTLTAHSEGRDKGSTFTVRLPLRQDGDTDARPFDSPAPSAATGGTAHRRVLVIDDNRDSANTMVQLLDILGYEARVAYGAREALGTARAFEPQVVLLDLNMPDGDGYSVLSELRADPAVGGAFMAAMTGYGQQSDRESTRAAGFDEHLTKPVDMAQLQRVLQRATRP